jgi:hypothetical protein
LLLYYHDTLRAKLCLGDTRKLLALLDLNTKELHLLLGPLLEIRLVFV